MFIWLCSRSTPWPDLMPTSSRRKSGLSNGTWLLDGLTTRSAKWQEEDILADKGSTIHALLTLLALRVFAGYYLPKPKLDHMARCLKYTPKYIAAQSLHCVTPWEPKKEKKKHRIELTFITGENCSLPCSNHITNTRVTFGAGKRWISVTARLEMLTLHQCICIDHSLGNALWERTKMWTSLARFLLT